MNIKTPTLIIDRQKVSRNIERMLSKTEQHNIIFRPHFKTHQSFEIGQIFKDYGVNKITVSSVSMAMIFANNGWNDITIAFPVNLAEVNEINDLASRVNLSVLVESSFSMTFLSNIITHSLGIFLKIDTGYHRTGLDTDNIEIEEIIKLSESHTHLNFKGFLCHAGNTYNARGKSEIMSIMDKSRTILNNLKINYIGRFPNIIISYGDTPSCSMAKDCLGFDEIRPGNFVYYDVMQFHIGSCSIDDIAVAVACPVVAVHPTRNEIVVYGGAIHLSKEFIAADNNFKLFGYVVNISKDGWSEPIPGAYVSSLSQEHGIIKMPEIYINDFKPGDIVGILPVHSCLTANLLSIHHQII